MMKAENEKYSRKTEDKRRMRFAPFLVGSLFAFSHADAAEPVKTIDIYVTPYYSAARSGEAQPTVAVGKAFDALLTEGSEASLAKVVDAVQRDSGRVTPMTLMALAIRLDDAGLRDDSVFWFYVAKDRYLTASRVLDFSSAQLSGVRSAIGAFAALAGPSINGYAFCDVSRQRALRNKGVEWVASHPYEVVFHAALPALLGDRRKNLGSAISEMRQSAQDEAAALDKEATLRRLRDGRAQNEADARFCWK